jgi:simple sugar transport system permease protein
MGWMMGSGLRNIIDFNNVNAAQILDNLWRFTIFGIPIPTGMLLVVAICGFLMWLFFRSKAGIAISAVGMNPMFAMASGLDANKSRVLANMISTILGALGIIMYSQSFGFAALYDAPLMMAFQAVAAILVGGASALRSKVFHVFLGTLLLQGIFTNGPAVLASLVPVADLTEIVRLIVQNGVILFALTRVKGGAG